MLLLLLATPDGHAKHLHLYITQSLKQPLDWPQAAPLSVHPQGHLDWLQAACLSVYPQGHLDWPQAAPLSVHPQGHLTH